jgi:hypothetical protein
MKKVLSILIVLIMVSCSENKTTTITIVDSASVDSTKVIVDTTIVDSVVK